jgi:hypothetical protein
LGIFAFLRDLETRRGIVAGYFCEREKIDCHSDAAADKRLRKNPVKY